MLAVSFIAPCLDSSLRWNESGGRNDTWGRRNKELVQVLAVMFIAPCLDSSLRWNESGGKHASGAEHSSEGWLSVVQERTQE